MPSILVIEDNDEVRREVVGILRYEGFEVAEAENGRRGVERARERPPDLIICDVMMPDLDGYETLATMRAEPALATVPFVFLTARAERADMRRGMELGADDYLVKPFSIDELVAAVGAALAKAERIESETRARLDELRQQISVAFPHELRTPISCVMGFAEMLSDASQCPPPEEVAALAKRILGAGLRMNRLAENSLLYMQLELLRRGRGDAAALAQVQEWSFEDVVGRRARELAAQHGRPRDLVLELHQGGVCGAGAYVAKLAHELIDNAFKFSTRGSPVRVVAAPEGDTAVLRVVDRGRGMSPEQTQAVDAFIQLDRLMHEQQGLGLGLYIAHRIAALWGARLTFETAPGQGTVVQTALPRPGDRLCAMPASPPPTART
jgi:two-component system sensor histidine kinase/response regulator